MKFIYPKTVATGNCQTSSVKIACTTRSDSNLILAALFRVVWQVWIILFRERLGIEYCELHSKLQTFVDVLVLLSRASIAVYILESTQSAILTQWVQSITNTKYHSVRKPTKIQAVLIGWWPNFDKRLFVLLHLTFKVVIAGPAGLASDGMRALVFKKDYSRGYASNDVEPDCATQIAADNGI